MNLISLPISDLSITDAASLAAKIGANCNEILKWDAIAQTWISYNTAMPPQAAFPIVAGEGYFVTVNALSNLELSGEGWNSPFGISLVTGYNMIGIPINDPTIQTAADLFSKIGPDCLEVYKWDAIGQSWISYNPYMPPQAAFDIEGGEGYLVRMTGAGTLMLTGESWCPGECPTPSCAFTII